MLFENLLHLSFPFLLLLAISLLVAYLASIRYQRSLSKFNGPFLASFTDLWRLWQAYWYHDRVIFPALQAKYGKVIRIGPRTLLFSEPDAIKEIYTMGFRKSDMYTVAAAVSKGEVVSNLFSTTDREWHARLRRSVSNAFALSTLIQYEPLTNRTTTAFLEQIDARFAGRPGDDGIVDLSIWLRYFAIDVIGEVAYSSPHGLLEAGRDPHGIMPAMHKFLRYFSVVLNCPPVDKLLWKNPAFLFLGKIGWYNKVTPTVPFAHRHITARLSAMEKANPHDSVQAETKQVDLLDKFLRAKQEHPDIVNDRAVLGLTLSMVNAGSDTTATTLAAIFFYLLKAPACMRKVYEELDAHFGPPRDLHSCVTSFADAQKLTYLDACIKETFRLHPALGGQLAERVVPSGGAYIAGEWVPEGTQVSCNSWTAHRHKPTFGADAEIFRPERWLESREEQLSAMNRALIAFGAGPHTCVGKNIALLEIYKLVPSVLRAFSIQLKDPSTEWKIYNLGFVETYDFFVRFQPRYTK